MIGYASCSTDEQDLIAQRGILLGLGVAEDVFISTTGSPVPIANGPAWTRPPPRYAPETPSSSPNSTGSPDPCPTPPTSAIPLAQGGVRLSLGGAIYDPTG